ncbi:MAG TPA: hypothetical protein VFY57_03980 [Rubrobacteraceae bacterium]|nr:hypothetical protein [Rubrobacteraceae bacterium]
MTPIGASLRLGWDVLAATGETLSKAEAVQAQIDTLLAWIDELGENFDEELGRIVPFDYSASLTAAMDLHGIGDPQTAWAVFSERAEALAGLRDRLQEARMELLERR